MRRHLLLATLVAAVTAATAAPLSITLPPETGTLKPSPLPGHAIAVQKCTICHSVDYIDYQPPAMTLAQWTAEMKKMKALYGAPLDDREVELLAAYLTSSYGDASTVPASASAPPPVPASPVAIADPTDVRKLLDDNGCFACHAVEGAKGGPGYRDVAARYRGDAGALTTVRAHIRDGGSGRWGNVPMPPFPTLSEAEATALAGFVLAQ